MSLLPTRTHGQDDLMIALKLDLTIGWKLMRYSQNSRPPIPRCLGRLRRSVLEQENKESVGKDGSEIKDLCCGLSSRRICEDICVFSLGKARPSASGIVSTLAVETLIGRKTSITPRSVSIKDKHIV